MNRWQYEQGLWRNYEFVAESLFGDPYVAKILAKSKMEVSDCVCECHV